MKSFRWHGRSRGLTLTESVTALLVLGIGFLSIATVYLERTQAAPAVLLHSKASRLAVELADQIAAARPARVHFENPVGVVCQLNAGNSQSQQSAANLMACWQDKVARTLPNGNGTIAHDSASSPPVYVITVSWLAPGSGTASYSLRIPAETDDAVTASSPPATRGAN
jgi:type IV pilus assembly protein PilV